MSSLPDTKLIFCYNVFNVPKQTKTKNLFLTDHQLVLEINVLMKDFFPINKKQFIEGK